MKETIDLSADSLGCPGKDRHTSMCLRDFQECDEDPHDDCPRARRPWEVTVMTIDKARELASDVMDEVREALGGEE